jgi:hypothetical protein
VPVRRNPGPSPVLSAAFNGRPRASRTCCVLVCFSLKSGTIQICALSGTIHSYTEFCLR